MSRVNESIFNGENYIIPLSDIAYIQRKSGDSQIQVFFRDSKYQLILDGKDSVNLCESWCIYRNQLEFYNLRDLTT